MHIRINKLTTLRIGEKLQQSTSRAILKGDQNVE